jgi:hypothetical protein
MKFLGRELLKSQEGSSRKKKKVKWNLTPEYFEEKDEEEVF